MTIGKTVKIISKDYPRFGEVGRVISREMTPLGYLFRIHFEDGDGLYQADKFKVLVEEDAE